MSNPHSPNVEDRAQMGGSIPGSRVLRLGRFVTLFGVVLPLLLIGGLKFTSVEIAALKPLNSGTPWLAWMYPVFGEAGASYVLGIVELATAALLIASPWSARAAVAGGAVGTLIFFVTSSLFLTLPVWEESLGGFPALNSGGQFLIKDIALLGITLVIMGERLARLAPHDAAAGQTSHESS